MAVNLTESAISMLSTAKWEATDVKPVLQVLEIAIVRPPIASAEDREMYRILLSDGSFYLRGMLATQRLGDLVRSHRLQRGSVVQLHDFVTTVIGGRVIIIIIDVDVIVPNCDVIGNAEPIPDTVFSELHVLNKSINRLKSEKKWILEEGVPLIIDAIKSSGDYILKLSALTTAAHMLGRQEGLADGYKWAQGKEPLERHPNHQVGAMEAFTNAYAEFSKVKPAVLEQVVDLSEEEEGLDGLKNLLCPMVKETMSI